MSKDNRISIKTKLPDDRTGVEVKTFAGHTLHTGFKDGRFEYDENCEEAAAIVCQSVNDHVTHWRPLMNCP